MQQHLSKLSPVAELLGFVDSLSGSPHHLCRVLVPKSGAFRGCESELGEPVHKVISQLLRSPLTTFITHTKARQRRLDIDVVDTKRQEWVWFRKRHRESAP